jgi:hypothetical protein
MVAEGGRGLCARAKRLARRGWRRGVGGGGEARDAQGKRGVRPRLAHAAPSALLRASARAAERARDPRARSRRHDCQWHYPLAIENRRAKASPCRLAVGEPPPVVIVRELLQGNSMKMTPARCVAARPFPSGFRLPPRPRRRSQVVGGCSLSITTAAAASQSRFRMSARGHSQFRSKGNEY